MELINRTRKVQQALYAQGVICSPLLHLAPFNVGSSCNIYLKLENLQPVVRCYKIRGALNAIAAHQTAEISPGLALQSQGVVTASAGNFALGLALACGRAMVPLWILVPHGASPMKLQRITTINPQARILHVSHQQWWASMLDASAYNLDLPLQVRQALFISPATNAQVIEGNGTIGLELAEASAVSGASEIHIMVPYGGGGLITGIAQVMRTLFAKIPTTKLKIFACEVQTGAPLHASLAAGYPVHVKYTPSFIDGIGSAEVLPAAFKTVASLINGSLVVTPQEVERACAYLLHSCGMVVEGAAAASLAAAWRYGTADARTVCIVSGGNITVDSLLQHCKH